MGIISGDIDSVKANLEAKRSLKQVCKFLAPFYSYYDTNGDGEIDFEEFTMIFHGTADNLTKEAQQTIFKAADIDNSNGITFEEFVACVMAWSLDKTGEFQELCLEKSRTRLDPSAYLQGMDDEADDDEEEPEEEDIPEDLADLPADELQRRLKGRSAVKMGLGTLLVLVFSDPMVDLLAEIGHRLNVSPFYVAFVLAPLTSNASEFVATYNYAVKKTKGAITTSLSTLVGAAIMNNTYCLGVFFTVIFVKDLAWEFTAETISIVLIQLAMGIIILRSTNHSVFTAIAVLSLYPLAMAIVAFLESSYVGMD